MPRSPATEDLAEENRRRFGRYQVTGEEVEIVVGKWQKPGTIIDESIGGIGILTDAITGIFEGQEVEILYADSHVKGYVRNLRRRPEDGRYCLGVCWNPPQQKGESETQNTSSESGIRQLVANYITHSGLNVVCHVSPADEGFNNVTLWDGSKFVADNANHVTFTRAGREQDLLKLGPALEVVQLLYGLPSAGSIEELVTRILDYEFIDFTQT